MNGYVLIRIDKPSGICYLGNRLLNERKPMNDTHIAELRRQNAALLEQVTELSAIVREIPAKLTAARLDGREGKPTQYDYARAGRALAVRV